MLDVPPVFEPKPPLAPKGFEFAVVLPKPVLDVVVPRPASGRGPRQIAVGFHDASMLQFARGGCAALLCDKEGVKVTYLYLHSHYFQILQREPTAAVNSVGRSQSPRPSRTTWWVYVR